jgi:glycine betaine/proline transport system permease protein
MSFDIPVDEWISAFVDFLLDHAQGLFDLISLALDSLTFGIEELLFLAPAWLLIALLTVFAWWRGNWRFAIFTAASLVLIVGMDLWMETVETLALVIAATLISLAVGIPLGILAAAREWAERLIRPALDLMQTMPAFVYLIPAAMFFGLGKVPGTVATIVFAMPPAVRLTNLGIRQVPKELVEAGLAFGCTSWQLLLRVQLPAALPSIMAGVNQTIMLALSMVVIASMIGAGGLGDTVLRGIQRLDVGLGFEGGIAVVILAIILDRLTQSFGKHKKRQGD